MKARFIMTLTMEIFIKKIINYTCFLFNIDLESHYHYTVQIVNLLTDAFKLFY